MPTPDADSFRIVAHCDFVVLSDANEAWFRKRNPLLIQTTETRTVPVDGTNGFPQLDLSLEEYTNPCQKIFWYLQSERNIAVNDWFNFSSRPSYDDVVSLVALVDPYVQSPGPPQSIEVSDRVVDTPALDLRVAVGPKTVNNPTSYGVGEPTCLFVGGQEAPELHFAAARGRLRGDLRVRGRRRAKLRVYEDRQHLVPHPGYSDGVLTVGLESPAVLHYTQVLLDGSLDPHGGNVVHTQVQLSREAAVAPTEERMLVDEDSVSSTATFTRPYGPHQVTLEASRATCRCLTPA